LVPVLTPLSPKLDIQICDSLAICEFLAESHPEFSFWPKDRVLRALARSAVAEMHSGFSALRTSCHSNFLAKYTGNVPVTEKAKKEVERAFTLWHEARTKTSQRLKELGEEDEGYLFGKFGIADSFFYPVLWVCGQVSLPPH
jgi:glutathione S-transferase